MKNNIEGVCDIIVAAQKDEKKFGTFVAKVIALTSIFFLRVKTLLERIF